MVGIPAESESDFALQDLRPLTFPLPGRFLCNQRRPYLPNPIFENNPSEERVLEAVLPQLQSGHPLCPVVALGVALASSPSQLPSDPALLESFSPPTVLTRATFDNKLAAVLRACGLDVSKYSGHSLRRGGATFALAAGVPGELIQAQGDWKTDAYKRYIDLSQQQRLSAVRKMCSHLHNV